MIPILSAEQIRQVDQYTIENEPVRSIDLMERASRAFVEKLYQLYSELGQVVVLAGTGNNGGDALAIARMLMENRVNVSILIVGNPELGSKDFQVNYGRFRNKVDLSIMDAESSPPDLSGFSLIIDGIFGSGLSRPVEGWRADLFAMVNRSGIELVSIDIASGLLTDGPWLSGNEAILQPSHTISFQLPKLAFFQPQLAPFVGQWHVVGIGLDSTFIGNCKTSYFLTEPRDIIQKVQMREKFMHKGDAGRLQLVVGSKGKMGAAVLATRAAIRAGVGLLTSQVPGCGVDILQISCPEAMVYTDDSKEYISSIQIGPGVTSVGIGPGLGTSKKTKGALSTFIQRWEGGPLVLDADALNILSEEPLLLSALPVGSILTPHPGEFQRLVGAWKDDQEKLEKLVGFCTKYQLNVVLKGAYSAVCDTKGQVFFNPTGNPGMATAGSGDVLLGLVSGLLVQGYLPDVALKLAVFLHGKAGDLAVQEKTTFGLIASDMIEAIPSAFRTLIS